MKRFAILLAALLCISIMGFAQTENFVPFGTALDLAIADVNERLGTDYDWSAPDIPFQYQYEQLRAQGDDLGCPETESSNLTMYNVTIARFDLELDDLFEWEYRYRYAEDGSIIQVMCLVPSQPSQPSPRITREPTSTPTPTNTPTPTPTDTPALEPIFGRDGPRILPMLVCGGLKTRLINGGTGRVIPGGLENNLRQMPDIDSPKIGFLEPGTVFIVMDGPFCNGDIAWYLVGDGVTPDGWTAEGSDGDYFLEPVLTNALPIGADNVTQLAPYGGTFAPGVQSISANWPGGVLVSTGDSLQLWRTLGGFVPLEQLQWEVATEFPTPHTTVFVDNTGNQWGIDLMNGTNAVIAPLNEGPFTAHTQAAGSAGAIAAIENESNFAAVVNQDNTSVSIISVGRSGAANTVELTLAHGAAVQDVAFSPSGMWLYVLTQGQLTVYPYLLGEGWSQQAMQVVNTDIALGKLAVDEGGSRVAIAGTTAAGTAAIRLFNNLNTELVGDETGVNYDAPAGMVLSRPSFSADGTLVAAHANNGSVVLMNTFTGGVNMLPVNNGQPSSNGIVAFSRDGLVLWVGNGVNGMQAYAVRMPEPPQTATPLSPVIVTATPTIGPVIITATTQPVIIVTATATTGPIVITATTQPTSTVTLAPTLPPPAQGATATATP